MGLGKRTLGGYKQNLVCTRSQEKGTVYPQETEPDLPMSVQQSLAEVLFKEVIITPAIVWPEAKLQGENSPTHQQKIGLKIY